MKRYRDNCIVAEQMLLCSLQVTAAVVHQTRIEKTHSVAADDGCTSRIWQAAADHVDKTVSCLLYQSTGSISPGKSSALARYCGNSLRWTSRAMLLLPIPVVSYRELIQGLTLS